MFVTHVSGPVDTMSDDATARACVRCRTAAAPEPHGYCPACVVHTRIEIVTGLRRLTEYLGAWAAFDEWCRAQRNGHASA
jgi:hypothetical protein